MPSLTRLNRGSLDKVNQTLLPIDKTNLTAYWPFWENAGTTLYDETKAGNDGTISGGVWTWLTDFAKPGLSEDGTDDYVSTPVLLFDTKQNLSVAGWVKFDSITAGEYEGINGIYEAGPLYWGMIYKGGSGWRWYHYDGAERGVVDVGSASAGIWYFLAGTYNTTDGYVLWVYDNSADTWNQYTSTDTTLGTSTKGADIGDFTDKGFSFTGSIGMWMNFKGVELSESQIKTICNKTMP